MGKNGNLEVFDAMVEETDSPLTMTPKPPKDLSTEGKRLFCRIQAEYEIRDACGLTLLVTACRHFCRLREAQKAIKAGGLTLPGRYGQAVANPACKIENDASSAMLRCFKSLALDLEPILSPGRPPGGER